VGQQKSLDVIQPGDDGLIVLDPVHPSHGRQGLSALISRSPLIFSKAILWPPYAELVEERCEDRRKVFGLSAKSSATALGSGRTSSDLAGMKKALSR
ncbi:hypothetical protein, partial [Ralstonia mannitolilytica]|uniref:hypothetical protein n=1 Tax=Ralstonia mannitolilytica TaxID=105219 RepID=UPI00292DFC7F